MTPVFNKEVADKACKKHMLETGVFAKVAGCGRSGLHVKARDPGGDGSITVEHEGKTYEVPVFELKKEDLSPY